MGEAEKTKNIIAAIQRYMDKHGNVDAIIAYRQSNDTYEGIVEYLDCLDEAGKNTNDKTLIAAAGVACKD